MNDDQDETMRSSPSSNSSSLSSSSSNLEFNPLRHRDFVDSIKRRLCDIIKNEPLLNDIDPNISLVELRNLLSFEHGESMKIFIRRADDQVFNVIVKLTSSLKELKEAIQLKYELNHKSSPSQFPKVINWKYVWRNYGLRFDNEKLADDEKQLRDYGIANKSELTFFRLSNKQ